MAGARRNFILYFSVIARTLSLLNKTRWKSFGENTLQKFRKVYFEALKTFAMAASLRNIDPGLKLYLKQHRLTDIYEVGQLSKLK